MPCLRIEQLFSASMRLRNGSKWFRFTNNRNSKLGPFLDILLVCGWKLAMIVAMPCSSDRFPNGVFEFWQQCGGKKIMLGNDIFAPLSCRDRIERSEQHWSHKYIKYHICGLAYSELACYAWVFLFNEFKRIFFQSSKIYSYFSAKAANLFPLLAKMYSYSISQFQPTFQINYRPFIFYSSVLTYNDDVLLIINMCLIAFYWIISKHIFRPFTARHPDTECFQFGISISWAEPSSKTQLNLVVFKQKQHIWFLQPAYTPEQTIKYLSHE